MKFHDTLCPPHGQGLRRKLILQTEGATMEVLSHLTTQGRKLSVSKANFGSPFGGPGLWPCRRCARDTPGWLKLALAMAWPRQFFQSGDFQVVLLAPVRGRGPSAAGILYNLQGQSRGFQVGPHLRKVELTVLTTTN